MSLDTDTGLASGGLAVTWTGIGTGCAVGNRNVIGHTDARLAARSAAVSGDFRSRSTGCAVSCVGVRLNADPCLATGHFTVAGNSVGASSAVGLVNHRAATHEIG